MTQLEQQRSKGRRGFLAMAAFFAVLVVFIGGGMLRPNGIAYARAPIGPADDLHIESVAPTGTIIVKKVGNTAGSGFTGQVTGITDPSFSSGWGPISVGGSDSVSGLAAAPTGTQYRISEFGPLAPGWTLVGYKEMPQGANSDTACPADNSGGDYTHAGTGASTTVYQSGAGNVRVVCVLNTYATPAVEQEPAHLMVRKVRDPQGAADNGATFTGTINGPADTTWGPLAIGGQTALMAVAPGAYTVAEDAPPVGWSLVGYQVLSSTTQNCSTDPADYKTNDNVLFFLESNETGVVCVMNIRQLLQPVWHLTICKVVDNNGDGVDDGGLFKIDLTWKNQLQMTISLTVHESDGPNGKCETVQPPFDILAKAQEEGVRPNGWNGDVAGYPMVKVDNGLLVSGDTATVTSGPDHTITFHNKTQPRPETGKITVTKRTLFNNINNPSDDGGWHMTIKSAQCQVMQTKDTVQGSPVGSVVFANLPICNDYVVSEDASSKPLYVAVSPTSVGGVTPSNGTEVDFVNDREFHLPCIFNCDPGTTPTPTSTPSSTPPTGTPPATTGTGGSPTSTPTDVVLGQKTPGPQITPIPPSTGTGMTSIVGGHSAVATFGLLGLVVSLVVFAGAAIAMRKRA